MRVRHAMHAAVILLAASVHAEDQGMTAEQFEGSLHYQTGTVSVRDGLATFDLGTDYKYLGPQDTSKVLEIWGNPPDDTTLGMIVPRDGSVVQEGAWAVVVQFEEEGYVDDKDAASLDYDKMLKQMREASEDQNKERKKHGLATAELVGWAEPPHYDAAAKKLYWAKDLKFSDGSGDTLNYDIRVLGRRGVLVLTAVSGMSDLASVRESMQGLLGRVDFNPGHRYADFQKGDKVAAYGIGALILGAAGAAAVKGGLLKGLLVAILAAKKLVIAGLVAVGAFFKKLFGGGGGGKQKAAASPPPLPPSSGNPPGWGR